MRVVTARAWPGLAEVGEFTDVMNNHIVLLLTDLASSPEQPERHLLAGVDDPFRDAVGDDRFGLPYQRYSTEPCDQWFPAAAFDDDLQARPQAVRCLDLGFVLRRHLPPGRVVLAGQRLEHRGPHDPMQP